ncbi:hypothetical protein DPMN_144158 [Dreissena polymorpha]|uniref:Uncharacterized protein n=1 Tax=Dreissena polymorpha TaxID=45954 RepID=A0A9D4JKP8_DREPO|nr:hypothetical protein DPMN_144158 [Dreissena polymorpha]
MELHAHNPLCIAIAVEAIRIQTSVVLVPSFYMVAPNILKLVTSPSFSPCMVMSARMSFLLFTMIFDFSVLTSIPYTPALSKSLFLRSSCSLLVAFIGIVISESQVGGGSVHDRDKSVIVLESPQHYLIKK